MSFTSKHISLYFLVWVVAVASAVDADKPNVIFIITDDQGYGDLSCHGNPVLKTPHLDELYRESVRLTDYHVAPTCSPTRSAIQTSRWPNRVGVWHTVTDRCMLDENEITLGQMFRAAGYKTGMFGKWHLGDNYPYRPEDRGYDEVLRHGGGGVGQTPDFWDNAYFDDTYFRNGKPEPQQGFCTDVFFRAAQDYIAKQQDAKQPFFAYIATNAPHGPFHAPPSFSQPFEKMETGLANFLGMIANIDDNVGRLREFLDDRNLTKNTIFVFTTDNGTAMGHKVFTAGMRGHKGSEYDGGHRVPFMIHWPEGKLAGGRDVEPICAHVDVMPTLLDLCGIELPGRLQVDGRSLKPLLHSDDSKWPDRVLITDSQRIPDPKKWRKSSVMTSRWRLVNQTELYDMSNDPGQQNNVSKEHPAVVERLQTEYEAWWRSLQKSFERKHYIHLDPPSGEVVNLTAHDWATRGGVPWNQAAIRRAMNNSKHRSHWNVKINQSGRYKISLRRWPRESNAAIDAAMAPGADVPGNQALRATPGKKILPQKARLRVGDRVVESQISKGAQESDFELELAAGKSELEARFVMADGSEIGAYYVYVEKL